MSLWDVGMQRAQRHTFLKENSHVGKGELTCVASCCCEGPNVDWTVNKDDDLDDKEEDEVIRLSQSKGHSIITLNPRVLQIKVL